MKCGASILFYLTLAVGCFGLQPGRVCAQPTNPGQFPTVPPIPVLRSPVDSFRTLLVMPGAERREQLAKLTPEVR